MSGFFTNDNEKGKSAPIQAPALSITKVSVAGGLVLGVLSGLAGLIEPLNGSNPVIAAAVLDLARQGILFATLVAVADILARSATAILTRPSSAATPEKKPETG